MTNESLYLLAADAILISHVLVVIFVVGGLVFIYVGAGLSWRWVRNFWFRVIHLASIMVVLLQSWVGVLCPLTIWEMNLRQMAGDNTYEGSFIQHWLQTILYYDAPGWVFTLGYTLFGMLVLVSWFIIRPIRFKQTGSSNK
jgi:polyferredoxin